MLRVTGLWGEFTGDFPAQRTSNAENVSIWWRHQTLSRLIDSRTMKMYLHFYDFSTLDVVGSGNDTWHHYIVKLTGTGPYRRDLSLIVTAPADALASDGAGALAGTIMAIELEIQYLLQSCSGYQSLNKTLSIWQLCRDSWHRKFSLRQLTVPPVTTKLSNWRSFVFSEWFWMIFVDQLTPFKMTDEMVNFCRYFRFMTLQLWLLPEQTRLTKLVS